MWLLYFIINFNIAKIQMEKNRKKNKDNYNFKHTNFY